MVVRCTPHSKAQKSLSTRLLKNSTLLDDEVEDGKINKLINWIIKKLDLIVIAVKNNEIDSRDGSRVTEYLSKPKYKII